MSKLALAIAELQRSERRLAHNLRALAARHHSDHDISHLASDLAGWSDEHVAALSDHRTRRVLRLPAHPRRFVLSGRLQERLSDLLRHRQQPSLLLLADLRRVHRVAAGVSLDWELLAQAAQATKDGELLAVTSRCRLQTLRQMRWANAMLKELSPQVLAD
ncbi:hypothetical protein [Mycobacterium sp. URHB0021]